MVNATPIAPRVFCCFKDQLTFSAFYLLYAPCNLNAICENLLWFNTLWGGDKAICDI